MILITGGAGYIGSVLTGLLLKNGNHVKIIDSLIHGQGEVILNFMNEKNFCFQNKDIRDIKNTDLQGVDTIVHLAGIVGEKACNKAQDSTRVNYVAARKLYRIANTCKVNRFIFASTCSLYGTQEGKLLTENSKLNPISKYAKAKESVERFLSNLPQDSNCKPIILRFATAYGVSPRMRFDLTVNDFTKEITMDRELTVYDLDTYRPYCHVMDIARAIRLMIQIDIKNIASQVFNVGETQENYTKRKIAEKLKEIFPASKIISKGVVIDRRNYQVSFEKIAQVGFKSSWIVPEGIIQVKNIIENKIIPNPDNKKYYN